MADEKRELAYAVAVDGNWYRPGDDIPPDVAAKIRNPKAWKTDADTETDRAAQERRAQAGTDSGHRLASTVHVDGNAYGPNDYIPADIASKIRNPKAWEGGKLPDTDTDTATAPAQGDGGGDGDGETGAPSNPDSDGGDTTPKVRRTGGRPRT